MTDLSYVINDLSFISRKLFFLHKILNGLVPSYLLTVLNLFIKPDHLVKVNIISASTKTFESSFYLYCIKEWNNLSEEIPNIESVNKFKKIILNSIRLKENSAFEILDTNGMKLLTCPTLNFTHLNYHKFSHGFRDSIDPMCKC